MSEINMSDSDKELICWVRNLKSFNAYMHDKTVNRLEELIANNEVLTALVDELHGEIERLNLIIEEGCKRP